MRELFLNSTWCTLFLSLVLFVPTTIVMPEFLRLWMGEAFAAESAVVAQLIAASLALHGAFTPYHALLKGTGRVHWLALMNIGATLLHIIAVVVLVSRFGVIGAGYSAWVVVWCGFAIVLYVCRRMFPEVHLGSMALRVLVIPVVVSLVCGGAFWWVNAKMALHGWVPIVVSWLVMAGVLSAALWTFDHISSGPQGAAGQLAVSLRNFLGGVKRPASGTKSK